MRILLIIFLFSACSNYRFQSKANPFAQYFIDSLAVPMFYNHSNISNVSGVFTREVYHALLDFSDLKLTVSDKKADAVLIGIISSREKLKDSISTVSSKSVKNTFGEDALGKTREDFVVPSVNQMNLTLRIIVIRHPTAEEINFLQKDITQHALSSKIIFNEVIPLSESYTLKELRSEGTQVLGVQNRGVEKQAVFNLAKKAAISFKDMILYAF